MLTYFCFGFVSVVIGNGGGGSVVVIVVSATAGSCWRPCCFCLYSYFYFCLSLTGARVNCIDIALCHSALS